MTYGRGTYGLDSANLDTAANAKIAHGTGARFWFRYSAGAADDDPASQFKLLRPGELARLVAAGIDPIANMEASEDRPTQGAAAGKADGLRDAGYWHTAGLAKGASIYISWEPGNNPAQYNAVEDYYGAYNDGLQGEYVADGGYFGIPALVEMSKRGVIKHGWIPEAASVSVPNVDIPDDYAPPAKTAWDLWFPTKSQVDPAMRYLFGKLSAHRLVSCVWQNGNKWFGSGADEDIVLIGGPLGSHLEAAGQPTPVHPVNPPPVHPTPPPRSPMHGRPVPSLIAHGTGQYFGSIDGPAASHGGFYPSERPLVKLIQQQLVYLGFVPGHHDINDGWADGIFDVHGGGVGHGPTSRAVAAFQHRYMPGTRFYGQLWWDDWQKLASL